MCIAPKAPNVACPCLLVTLADLIPGPHWKDPRKHQQELRIRSQALGLGLSLTASCSPQASRASEQQGLPARGVQSPAGRGACPRVRQGRRPCSPDRASQPTERQGLTTATLRAPHAQAQVPRSSAHLEVAARGVRPLPVVRCPLVGHSVCQEKHSGTLTRNRRKPTKQAHARTWLRKTKRQAGFRKETH